MGGSREGQGIKWEQEVGDRGEQRRSKYYLWHGKKRAEISVGRLLKGFFQIMIRSRVR